MSEMKLLSVYELDSRDVEWLVKAAKTLVMGTTATDLINGMAAGPVEVWRFGDFEGVLVTHLYEHTGGRELYILCAAGNGVVKHADTLYPTMIDRAKKFGCRWIGVGTTDDRLGKVLRTKFKGKKIYEYNLLELEIDDEKR